MVARSADASMRARVDLAAPENQRNGVWRRDLTPYRVRPGDRPGNMAPEGDRPRARPVHKLYAWRSGYCTPV